MARSQRYRRSADYRAARCSAGAPTRSPCRPPQVVAGGSWRAAPAAPRPVTRSEEHTSELQSHSDLVCRLLLEKKKKHHDRYSSSTTTDGTLRLATCSRDVS